MSYFDEIEIKREGCKTIHEYSEFTDWLINELYQQNLLACAMEEAIVRTYGLEALDKITNLAMELSDTQIPMQLEMNEFGYLKDGVRPIPMEFAIKNFNGGNKVLLLFPDNTEKEATNIEEIQTHKGMFGISQEELAKIAASILDLEME